MEINPSSHNNIPLKPPDLAYRLRLEDDVDRLINSLSSTSDEANTSAPEIPESVQTYTKMVKSELESYESLSTKVGYDPDRDSVLINSVSRIGKLASLLGEFSNTASFLSVTLQMVMVFMEDELQALLEQSVDDVSTSSYDPTSPSEKTLKSKHFSGIPDVLRPHQHSSTISTSEHESYSADSDDFPSISDQTLSQIRRIVTTMVSAGYEKECLRVYTILRRSAFNSAMKRRGFQKVSMDEIAKMNWEQLESHIVRWSKVVRYTSETLLPRECNLWNQIFPDNSLISMGFMKNLAADVAILFLNISEAIAMTKREADRLFKVLDFYESLTKLITSLETILEPRERIGDLKLDLSAVIRRLGKAVVGMFSDLESSIKNDMPKSAVPNGDVDPVSRYTMNYLRYACDYKDSLDHVFQQYHKYEELPSGEASSEIRSSFSVVLLEILDLLDENLDSKSKLYKDPSLGCIFLMNNDRYIQQRIKDSPEMNELVGSEASQKSSGQLRACHKNYQRETWRKVLLCLSLDGLQVNGKVQSSILKERFKNFNQFVEEIHKTQTNWVVSDEQLRSELRVSISSMLIPAYRSFLGKSSQYLTPGRQNDKYVKYQPEDIEATIDELFDGNSSYVNKMRK